MPEGQFPKVICRHRIREERHFAEYPRTARGNGNALDALRGPRQGHGDALRTPSTHGVQAGRCRPLAPGARRPTPRRGVAPVRAPLAEPWRAFRQNRRDRLAWERNKAGCLVLTTGPIRAGDRIRTGDVQLGKEEEKPTENARNPCLLNILRKSDPICKGLRTLSEACEIPRKFRRSQGFCGSFAEDSAELGRTG